MRRDKIDKINEHILKVVFYVVGNSFLYYIIRDSKFLHWSMGGNFSVLDYFYPNYPCVELPLFLNEYYTIMLGYYTSEFVYTLAFNRHRNDFVEMLLHHFVTCTLVAFSHLTNQKTIGALILIIHGSSDIWCNFMKIAFDLCRPAWAYIWYFVMLITFTYTRCLIYPFVALKQYYE